MQDKKIETCSHLEGVVSYLLQQGGTITYSGQAWSNSPGTWIYFNLVLDCPALSNKFNSKDDLKIHEHLGTHSGSEMGLLCKEHDNAVMGVHPKFRESEKIVS